jgi:hypothetical protein
MDHEDLAIEANTLRSTSRELRKLGASAFEATKALADFASVVWPLLPDYDHGGDEPNRLQ